MPLDPVARVPSAPAGVLHIAAAQPSVPVETGPTPLIRSLVGLGLGLVAGALAVLLTPRQR